MVWQYELSTAWADRKRGWVLNCLSIMYLCATCISCNMNMYCIQYLYVWYIYIYIHIISISLYMHVCTFNCFFTVLDHEAPNKAGWTSLRSVTMFDAIGPRETSVTTQNSFPALTRSSSRWGEGSTATPPVKQVSWWTSDLRTTTYVLSFWWQRVGAKMMLVYVLFLSYNQFAIIIIFNFPPFFSFIHAVAVS